LPKSSLCASQSPSAPQVGTKNKSVIAAVS
jgi:hypothetical protein